MLAGLACDPTRTIAPFVDLPRQISLAIPQYALLFSELFPLFGLRFQELTSDLFKFISGSDELTLDRVCLAVECLLHLAQAEPNRYAVPSLALVIQNSIFLIGCSSNASCLPRQA
jgi:hypothetical protein